MTRSPFDRRAWTLVLAASLTLAPAAYGFQETEVPVGDFTLLRSVDFMTDDISYLWARSGGEIPSFEDIALGDYGPYETLQLRCEDGELEVSLRFNDKEPGRGSFRRSDDPTPMFESGVPTPTRMRFDSDPPDQPSDWIGSRSYGTLTMVVMPSANVAKFIAAARPASRVRVRLGAGLNRFAGRNVVGQRDMEFSLLGFTRSVELLGCAAPLR